MYQISRVYLGDYGHGQAFFPSNILDFRKAGGLTGSSVLLFAENGKGKTSALSGILHVFLPGAKNFVQHLQKRDKHHLPDYFTVGKPGFIIIELTQKHQQGFLGGEDPALIVGVCANKRVEGALEEEFFLAHATTTRFDSLPMVEAASAGARLNWSKSDADEWMKSMRRRDASGEITFKTAKALRDWDRLLNENGLKTIFFRNMVSMASREGGVDAFLKGTTSTEILERIFGMIFSDDDYAAQIRAVNTYLSDAASLPENTQKRDTLSSLLNHEASFIEGYEEYDRLRKKGNDAGARAKGIMNAVAGMKDAIEAAIDENDSGLRELEEIAREAEETAIATAATAEAYRLKIVRSDMAEAASDLAKAEVAEKDARLTNDVIRSVSLFSRKHLDATQMRVSADRTWRELSGEAASRRQPVETAGSLVVALRNREISKIDSEAAKSEKEIAEHRRALADAEHRVDLRHHAKAASDLTLARFHEGSTEIAAVLGAAKSSGIIGHISEGLEGMHAAQKACDEDVATIIGRQSSLKSDHRARVERIEIEKRSLARLEKTHKQQVAANATLSSGIEFLKSSRTRLVEEFAAVIELDDHTDLSDPSVPSSLNEVVLIAEDRMKDLQRENAAITGSIEQLNDVGAFEDMDVAKVIDRCREMEIDAAPFARWLSDNVVDTEKARQLVENNLGAALGIRVFSAAAASRIRAAYDRETWGLSKPVAVVVIDANLDALLASGSQRIEHCVLSAQTDYGYNKASLARRLEYLGGKQSRIVSDIESEANRARLAKAAINIVIDCKTVLGGRTENAFRDFAETALRETADTETDIARSHHQIAALEEAQSSHLRNVENNLSERNAAEDRRREISAAISRLDSLYGRIGDRSERDLEDDLEAATEAYAMQKEEARQIAAKIEGCSRQVGDLNSSRKHHLDSIALIRHRLTDENCLDVGNATLDGAEASYVEMARLYDSTVSEDQKVNDAKKNLENAQRAEDTARADLDAAIVRTSRSPFTKTEVEQRLMEIGVRSGTDMDALLNVTDERISTLKSEIQRLNAALVRMEDARKTRDIEGVTRGEIESLLERIVERGIALRDAEEALRREVGSTRSELEELRERCAELDRAGQLLRNRLLTLNPSLKRLADALESVTVFAQPCEVSPDDVDQTVDDALVQWKSSHKLQSDARRKAEKLSRASQAFVKDDGGSNIIPALTARYAMVIDNLDAHGRQARETHELVTAMVEALDLDIGKMNEQRASQLHTLMILVDVAKDRIARAVRIKIPNGRSPFAGREIMRLPSGLEIASLKSMPSMEVAEYYMNRLMRDPKNSAIVGLPQLIVALLNCISEMKGVGKFDVSILKPVDQSASAIYEAIHKLTGSGGQTITAALLINLLATKVASADDGEDNGGQGFIILDNPSGTANSKNLVDTQIEVAADFGIQMITTTGINDSFISSYDWVIQFAPVALRNKRVEIGLNYPLSNDIVTYGMEFKDPMADEIADTELRNVA